MLTTALASPSCSSCSTSSASSSSGGNNSNDRVSPPASGPPSPASGSCSSCRDCELPSCSECSPSRHRQKSAPQPPPLPPSSASKMPATSGGGTYVYPKLQLVQIDDAWYALNQTCLQIYQQLQMCGTAQLMPVDVVPLNKLPDCVRKSLSSCQSAESDGVDGKWSSAGSRRRHQQQQQQQAASASAAAAAVDERAGERCPSSDDSLRVYDVMSDSVNGSGKPHHPGNQRHQQQANNANNHNVSSSDEKSWWSRLFPYCSSLSSSSSSSASGINPQQQQQEQQPQHHPTESVRPDNRRRYAAGRQVHRRQHQIVQKLMEETSLIGAGAGDIHHDKLAQQPADPSPDGPCVCVVCQSAFATHRLLQRHRERVNHFGCSICFKSFKSCSSLQDHCDLLSHWSEGDSDDDSVDLDSDDEYFFSSETSDDD